MCRTTGFPRDPAIDIWGAGLVLLHLLLGKAMGPLGMLCLGGGGFEKSERCISTLLGMDCKAGLCSSASVPGHGHSALHPVTG